MRNEIYRIVASFLICIVAIIVEHMMDIPYLGFGLFMVAFIIAGGEVISHAVKNIIRGKVFDENFLMSVASCGALAIGEYHEAVAVMLFYQVGELFQDYAVNRSRNSIAELMDIRPDVAYMEKDGEIVEVDPFDVMVGDVIIVRPGEKIPLDGVVISGSSSLDTVALTGESVPRDAGVGDEVLSACVNINGLLEIEVTKEFGDSTVSKILDLVENAGNKKAPTEKFITKFAYYYTPVVVISALFLAILPPLLIEGAVFSDWLYRALNFLVVSCPCALVISVPLSFFGGVGGASKAGVLVKGGNYLEALAQAEVVVFDKTGTLTEGVFEVQKVEAIGISEAELLKIAAYAEEHSNHPIAVSLRKAYGEKIDAGEVLGIEDIAGYGIKATVFGKEVLAGNTKLMAKMAVSYSEVEIFGTAVHIAIDGVYRGYIVIADKVKVDAAVAVKSLKNIGIKETVMLTGDVAAVGEKVAGELGLDKVYTELLPADKVEKMEALKLSTSGKGKLVYVGDGINDAPVLAGADIGIAMGGAGSDAAIEAADIVIMTDEPAKIATAIKISKRTMNIVWQNIVFALVIKFGVLILSAFGLATMWAAVFADVGVAVIAVANSLRALGYKE